VLTSEASHGRLKHGNPSGDPNTAPRCGARTRAGRPCRAPAVRGKTRCRLHGGLSTGPTTLEGVARIRAARTQHGRFSAEGLAVARWARAYVRNGYRSLRALGHGRIRGHDGQGYLRALLMQEEADGIPLALLDAQRLTARAAVVQRDAERLRAKGLLSHVKN